jgi:hypothetical protein
VPDWQELVRSELAGLDLEPHERAEVIEELAAHLDDVYAGLRGQGLAEEDAIKCSLSEVKDWRNLRRKIQVARRKENIMPDRVKQLWLPCILTFALFLGFLMLIHSLSLLIFGHPPRIATHDGMPRMFPAAAEYIPWLISLPIVGAIGAFFSHRAGGTLRAMFSSVLFPVTPFLVFFMVGFPLALNIRDQFARGYMLSSFLDGLAVFVLLPAVALVAGGLFAQLYPSRRLSSRSVAAH